MTTSTTPAETMNALYAALFDSDGTDEERIRAAMEYVTPNCVLEGIQGVQETWATNREEFVQWLLRFHEAFADQVITPRDVFETDRAVVYHADIKGTHLGTFHGIPATGNHVEFSVIAIYRVNEDRTQLEYETAAWDLDSIKRQIGVQVD